jgi:predicted nucleic acid-binding protein
VRTRFADQDFTLTDAIAFALMERLEIRRAFAFDHDFGVAGFDLVA